MVDSERNPGEVGATGQRVLFRFLPASERLQCRYCDPSELQPWRSALSPRSSIRGREGTERYSGPGWARCIGPFCPPPLDPNGNPLQGNLSETPSEASEQPSGTSRFTASFPWLPQSNCSFGPKCSISSTIRTSRRQFGDLNDSQFGQSTQMLGRSLAGGAGTGGFSSLYQVGGPRSIQFAMKLQF